MNQYVLLHRLRWPIMLLVFGVTAILDEYTAIGYDKSWPLYILAWGILRLAESAILAQNPPVPPPLYPGYPPAPGTPYAAWNNPAATQAPAPGVTQSTTEEGR